MNAYERKQLQRELRQLTKTLDYLTDPQRKEKVNLLRWQLFPNNFTKDGAFSFSHHNNQEEPA